MIGNDWDEKLNAVWESKGYKNFESLIDSYYRIKTIFPLKENIFNSLKLTPYNKVRVVIVGQDPYHGIGEAHGLSFSVQKGVPIPPSLKNIFKELSDDLGIAAPLTGDLTKWAQSGVLLLNSILTVEKDLPASHKNIGWEKLTDYIIKKVNEKTEPVVFILWGNFAKSKKELISNPNHLILSSTHPSPFSAYNGFFGSKPFSKTNDFLQKNNLPIIDWRL